MMLWGSVGTRIWMFGDCCDEDPLEYPSPLRVLGPVRVYYLGEGMKMKVFVVQPEWERAFAD